MYDELCERIVFLKEQNRLLWEENEQLRQEKHEAIELAFQGALASDKMKLDLILSGCLTKPTG
jgi:hypothetical protein